MPTILTETIIRKQYRCSYIYAAVMIVGGLALFIYGLSTLPNTTPESSSQEYQYNTPTEQKTADLRNYQIASLGFKLTIGGVGSFIWGLAIYVITSRREQSSIDEQEEALRKEMSRKSKQSAKVYTELSHASEKAVITPVTAHVTAHVTAPVPVTATPITPSDVTLRPPTAKPSNQYTVYHLQKQEHSRDNIRGKVYTGYFGHYPPNYRNYMEAHQV